MKVWFWFITECFSCKLEKLAIAHEGEIIYHNYVCITLVSYLACPKHNQRAGEAWTLL